jgi:photosystem II stability/assembly factor-like uncharacterized protein
MKSPSSGIARGTITILILWSLTTTIVVASYSRHLQPLANGSSADRRGPLSKGSAIGRPDQTAVLKTNDILDRLPLSFEPNHRLVESRSQFFSRGDGYSIHLYSTGVTLLLRNSNGGASDSLVSQPGGPNGARANGSKRSTELKMRLERANPAATMRGLNELPGKTNYLLGKEPKDWLTNVANYARIEQKDVYPGVHLVYYGNQRQLEYDFRIDPGANAGRIKLNFEGAQSLRIDPSGDLILTTAAGEVRQKKPFAYQTMNGVRQEVASRYVLKGKHRVGFKLGRYDRSRPLVIDPVLIYSSYLGFEGQPSAIAIDDSGNMYITGGTVSNTLPVTAGAIQPGRGNDGPFIGDAFVAKVNAAGNALVYLTYLGGSGHDNAADLAVDAEGNAYVTGPTASSNFPTTANAFKRFHGGSACQDAIPGPGTPTAPCYEAFVTKLNATGTSLVYSTFLGGDLGGDFAKKLALDTAGNVYVAGYTHSTDFPTTPGTFQDVMRGQTSLFVTKLNTSGSALLYSTYLGGSGHEGNLSIGSYSSPIGFAVDSQGGAFIGGTTDSPDFPVTPGVIQPRLRRIDGYVTRLNPAGTALVYSTYLGGSAEDGVQAIAVDADGNAHVTGLTYSTDFPVAKPFQGSAVAPFYRSTNGGVNWSAPGIPQLAKVDDTSAVVRSMAVAPDDSSTLYMGTIDGLFKSVDHGASWKASGLTGERVRRLTIDPRAPSTIFAATLVESNDDDAGHLYKSIDAGNTWDAPILGGAIFNDIVVDPADSSTIYVAAGAFGHGSLSGILKSVDGGRTWRGMNAGLSAGAVQQVSDLAIDPTDSSTLYAGTLKGVFKTTNGGGNWSLTSMSGDILSLQIDPRKPDTLYAATQEDDEDATATLPDPDDGRFNPRRRQVRITGSANPGLFRTVNGGASWSPLNNGLGSNQLISSIAVDPRNPSTVYVAVFGGSGLNGVFKSVDRGDSWERVKGLPEMGARLVVVDPQASVVYASFLTGTLFGLDAFITKLDPSGTTLVYSTYIGGAGGREEGKAIAVDSAGNAYVAGETDSDDFNVTPGAFDSTFVGRSFVPDVFVTKVSREGGLLYSTYLGGDLHDNATGIVVNSRGIAYVTGATWSENFPTVDPFRSGLSGVNSRDPFIARLDLSGSLAAGVPRISNATVSGKKLIVEGEGFKEGALIMLAGVDQKTANDSQLPSTRLIGKKAGKRVKPGSEVMIRVKNPDGATSDQFLFKR